MAKMDWEQASKRERQRRALLVKQADILLKQPQGDESEAQKRKPRRGKTVPVHPNSMAARKWGRTSIKSYTK